MIIEGKVKELSLQKMGVRNDSEFVMTIEVWGSKTELKFPVVKNEVSAYELGQVIELNVEVSTVASLASIDDGANERMPFNKLDSEEYTDDKEETYDDTPEEKFKPKEAIFERKKGSLDKLEDILTDDTDELTDEEIVAKIGKKKEKNVETVVTPKITNLGGLSLTESDYQSGIESDDISSKQKERESSMQGNEAPATPNLSSESMDDSAAPIGEIMGGYINSEDIDDDDEKG